MVSVLAVQCRSADVGKEFAAAEVVVLDLWDPSCTEGTTVRRKDDRFFFANRGRVRRGAAVLAQKFRQADF